MTTNEFKFWTLVIWLVSVIAILSAAYFVMFCKS
jgi:hypothetical protein